MKNIIITGAAGLAGQNLTPLLIKKGYHVTAIDRSKNIHLLQELNPKARCILADVSKHGEWEAAFANTDAVIMLHAQIAAPSPDLFVQSNINGVKNVLHLCKKNRIKNLIHVSSSVVISVADDDYTRTKRAGEQLVKKSTIPHTILRPPLMYGCFDAKHLGWITRFMQKLPIVPVPGSGKYVRQPLYVNDLCNVILALVQRKPKNEIWNITGHERIPYIDLLKIICKARGWKRIFIPIPLPLFARMLTLYSFITRKTVFTPEQMQALIAGDEFPIDNWSKTFHVPYTPFKHAIWQTWHSPQSKYAKKMVSPHEL